MLRNVMAEVRKKMPQHVERPGYAKVLALDHFKNCKNVLEEISGQNGTIEGHVSKCTWTVGRNDSDGEILENFILDLLKHEVAIIRDRLDEQEMKEFYYNPLALALRNRNTDISANTPVCGHIFTYIGSTYFISNTAGMNSPQGKSASCPVAKGLRYIRNYFHRVVTIVEKAKVVAVANEKVVIEGEL